MVCCKLVTALTEERPVLPNDLHKHKHSSVQEAYTG
jgi:hypothetical protein